jgi:lipoate-protein ligase A
MKAFQNPLNGIAHYLYCTAELLQDSSEPDAHRRLDRDDFIEFMREQIANIRESEPGAYETEWENEIELELMELSNIWEKMIRP